MAAGDADGELDILDIDDLFGGDEEMLFGDELALSPLFPVTEDHALVPVPPVPPLPDPQPAPLPLPPQPAPPPSAPTTSSGDRSGRRKKGGGNKRSRNKSKLDASSGGNKVAVVKSKASSKSEKVMPSNNAAAGVGGSNKSASVKRGSEKKSETKPINTYQPLPKNEDLNLTPEQMKMFFPFIPLGQDHGSRKFVKHFPNLDGVLNALKPPTQSFPRELISELHQLVGVMADQHLYLSTHNARMDAWLHEFAPALLKPKPNEPVPATNPVPASSGPTNTMTYDHAAAASALPDKLRGEYMVKLKLSGVMLPQPLTAIKKGFVPPPLPIKLPVPAPQRQKRERAIPKPAFPTIRHVKSRILTPSKLEKPPVKLVDVDEISLWEHVSSLESNINLKNLPKFLTEVPTRRAHNFGLFRNRRRKLDEKVEKSFHKNNFGLFDKLASLLVPEEGDDNPKARGRYEVDDELDVSDLSVDERTFVHLRAANMLPDVLHLGHTELDDIIDDKIADLNEEVVAANDIVGRIRDNVVDFVAHEEMCKIKAKTSRAHLLKYQQLLLKKYPNCKKSQKDAWLSW